MRAMQTGNADAALFFASEIEKKYPNNESVKQFKDILMKHSAKLATDRGIAIPGSTVGSDDAEDDTESSEDDDEQSSSNGNNDDDDESSGGEEESNQSPAREPSRPSSLPPSSKASRPAPQPQQPSIRDLVTLNPSREIDDEVDRMFEDADRQIAAEMQRYATSRK